MIFRKNNRTYLWSCVIMIFRKNNRTYLWSCVIMIFRKTNRTYLWSCVIMMLTDDGDCITSTLSLEHISSVASLLTAQVLVDRTLCCSLYFIFFFHDIAPPPPPPPFFFFFFNIDFFHINNILQLSMYHCMTYIQ